MREGHGHARHLAEGVDAGIGPPGSMHGHVGALERRERVLEQALNGGTSGLALKAHERRAVVGHGQAENTHRAVPGYVTKWPECETPA